MSSQNMLAFSSVPCFALQLIFRYVLDNRRSLSGVNDIESVFVPFNQHLLEELVSFSLVHSFISLQTGFCLTSFIPLCWFILNFDDESIKLVVIIVIFVFQFLVISRVLLVGSMRTLCLCTVPLKLLTRVRLVIDRLSISGIERALHFPIQWSAHDELATLIWLNDIICNNQSCHIAENTMQIW